VEGVKVVHAIPGRVRLKVTRVKDNPGLAAALEDGLSAIEGVRWVEVNPRTGSVLVLYEVGSQVPRAAWRRLSDALTPLVPGLDVEDLEARLARGAGGESSPAPPLDGHVSGLFGTLNASLSRVTGGVDLALLVPLALLFLGIRELLVSDKVRSPAWYDFLWFAFGTFIALNPAGEPCRAPDA
jgi:hypothetical protein